MLFIVWHEARNHKGQNTNLTPEFRISTWQTVVFIIFLFINISCAIVTHEAHALMFSLCKGFPQINSRTKNNLSKKKNQAKYI